MSEICFPTLSHPGIVWGAVTGSPTDSRQVDRVLAERLKERDPQAMAELYDRYGRIVYTLLLRTVRDAAVAEDLVQETFLRVWNRAVSFDPERGALGTWIVTVARNQGIDYLRSVHGRMAASEVDLCDATAPLAPFDVEHEVMSISRQRRLRGALKKLTPSQRKVIHLAYFEGLSHSEMAHRMKQPLGTVKTWVRAALRVLREEMALFEMAAPTSKGARSS